LGPLLKALVEKLQVALVLLAEVPVALDLVAALMVHQVIVVPEPMVLPTGDLVETQTLTAETLAMEHPVVTQVIAVLEAEARVMTDHPAMETVGPPVVVMVAVTVAATVVATAAVMAEAMVVVMVVVMAVVTVEVMAVVTVEVMVVVMAAVMAVETNRSYQKETPPFPLACDEFSANASTIRTLPALYFKRS
jgi:hypothetical protein